MNDAIILGFAGLAGIGLGTFFFGGLWWTIRRGTSSPCPARWFLGSALLRMGVALAGFYFIGGGEWPRLVACFVGFLVARFTITWLTKPTRITPRDSTPEVPYAS
jgi:F1F0 ATPase subunit 2